jgi:hypothetical protein|uniref:Uncharacterized protein n=1 Tax=Fagus sylvatica TaxID=28930 RepID=A0A2N9G381_FAGSY
MKGWSRAGPGPWRSPGFGGELDKDDATAKDSDACNLAVGGDWSL